MQAAFQWRFPGLFLHIFLYTFFYFHATSDPAHLLSQHFGCYCCPAFSLASPFVFPFFSYLTLHLPAHFLYQHFGCYYCLIIFPRFPFHSFPFSHIYDVFLLLIFLSQLSGWLLCPLSFSTFHLLFSVLRFGSSSIPTADLVLSPLHSYRSCLQPARFLYQLSGWWLLLFQFYRATGSKVGCTP